MIGIGFKTAKRFGFATQFIETGRCADPKVAMLVFVKGADNVAADAV
jgi:hypothetical protein